MNLENRAIASRMWTGTRREFMLAHPQVQKQARQARRWVLGGYGI